MNNVFQFNAGYSILAILVLAFIFLASKWNKSEKKPEKVYPRQPQFGDEEIEVILRKRHFIKGVPWSNNTNCPIGRSLQELFPGSLPEVFVDSVKLPINSSNRYNICAKRRGESVNGYFSSMYDDDVSLIENANFDDDSIIRTIKLVKQKPE